MSPRVECALLLICFAILAVGQQSSHFDLFADVNVDTANMMFANGFDSKSGAPKGSLLQYHYYMNNSFYNPYTQTATSYPDEEHISLWPSYSMTMTDTKIETISDFQKQMSKMHRTTFSAFGFAYSASKISQQITGLLNDGKSIVYMVDRTFDFYVAATWPIQVLSNQSGSRFNMIVNNMPANISTPANYDYYKQFIASYGTNYYLGAHFGAEIIELVQVNSSYASSVSQYFLDKQVSMYFSVNEFKLGLQLGHHIAESEIDETFKLNAQFTSIYNCGSASQKFDDWIRSCAKFPIVLYPQLHNYTEIISDPIKSSNLQTVIYEYMNTPPAE